VTGIDGSPSAIEYARNRFAEDGLAGDLQVGDFTDLPFADGHFDMAIDRAAITCCGKTVAEKAVAEVRRVLAPEGQFLFNCYSDQHSSYSAGEFGEDGVKINIDAGSLVNEGGIYMYGRRDIDNLFSDGWRLVSLEHMERSDRSSPDFTVHAEWRAVYEMIA
jgi:SAM-dependent methyltransferase